MIEFFCWYFADQWIILLKKTLKKVLLEEISRGATKNKRKKLFCNTEKRLCKFISNSTYFVSNFQCSFFHPILVIYMNFQTDVHIFWRIFLLCHLQIFSWVPQVTTSDNNRWLWITWKKLRFRSLSLFCPDMWPTYVQMESENVFPRWIRKAKISSFVSPNVICFYWHNFLLPFRREKKGTKKFFSGLGYNFWYWNKFHQNFALISFGEKSKRIFWKLL